MTEEELNTKKEWIRWILQKSLEKEGFYPQEEGELPTDNGELTLRISAQLSGPWEENTLSTPLSILLPPMTLRQKPESSVPFSYPDTAISFSGMLLRCRERVLVLSNNTELALTRKETDLLAYLAEHRNTTVSRQELLDAIWNGNYHGEIRTIDGHMKRLRHKLGPFRSCIQTVRSLGYRLIDKK